MKRNCRYFRYVHKVYILKIKEVHVLFDKVSSFRLREHSDSTTQSLSQLSLLDGTINVEYTAMDIDITSSPYTHANMVRACACARYESQRPEYHHFLHSSAILIGQYQPPFYFVPRAIRVDFRVFGCDTAFVVVHNMHVL